MNPRLRSILIVIGLLTVVIVAIILIPRGISLYYQSRGGQQIDYVMQSVEGIEELVCEPLPESNQSAVEDVEKGLLDLNRAVRLNRNNSQAYYYLGKANCLLGEPENAKEDYLQYTILRPENPLGYIGLGFAYEKSGDPISAKTAWESTKLVPKDFSMIGDEKYMKEQYDNAISWYSRAILLEGEQSKSSRFKWGVAAVLIGEVFPYLYDDNDLQIYLLSEDIKINGSELYWMLEEDKYQSERYGKNLYEYPTGDPKVGGMWWDGAAVTFVQAPCTAEFIIQTRATHVYGTGQIGRLQFEDDLTPFATFPLVEDWQNYEAEILLSKGNHLLGVRYLEDVGDAMIDWLLISQASNCQD